MCKCCVCRTCCGVPEHAARRGQSQQVAAYIYCQSSLRRLLFLVFWIQPRTIGTEGNKRFAYKNWTLRKPKQTNKQTNKQKVFALSQNKPVHFKQTFVPTAIVWYCIVYLLSNITWSDLYKENTDILRTNYGQDDRGNGVRLLVMASIFPFSIESTPALKPTGAFYSVCRRRSDREVSRPPDSI